MRIAVLSDIHANLPALEYVVEDINARGIKEIWCLGDYLGQGPFPNEVIEVIERVKAQCIIGNHDRKMLASSQKSREGKIRKGSAKAFSTRWTRRTLSRGTRQFLNGLPEKRRMTRAGHRFLLVHGSPQRINEPLGAATPRRHFEQIAFQSGVDVVLFGHTHVPFRRTVRGVLFFNPGSVGRPYDGDPRASYAILDIGREKVTARHIRLVYNVTKTTEAMGRENFPAEFLQAVSNGKALERDKAPGEGIIEPVLELAREYNYEKGHSHQVACLALKLFDQLGALHQTAGRYRPLLQSAALLHDIGWVKGRASHHKTSRDLIMQASSLPLAGEDRILVALMARYHRRALPQNHHKYYRDLPVSRRKTLDRMSALLRLADGMDRAHADSVKDLHCRLGPRAVTMRINADRFSSQEKGTVHKKADLFEKVFGKKIRLEVVRPVRKAGGAA